jgi:hypothetical protein
VNIVLCVLAVSTVAGVAYVWNDRFRLVPLNEFGIENIQRIGAWESPAWREAVWSRGWMTSAEWRGVNKRQLAAIDAELKRRGVAAKG